jgi:hypothetical protein
MQGGDQCNELYVSRVSPWSYLRASSVALRFNTALEIGLTGTRAAGRVLGEIMRLDHAEGPEGWTRWHLDCRAFEASELRYSCMTYSCEL